MADLQWLEEILSGERIPFQAETVFKLPEALRVAGHPVAVTAGQSSLPYGLIHADVLQIAAERHEDRVSIGDAGDITFIAPAGQSSITVEGGFMTTMTLLSLIAPLRGALEAAAAL